MGTISDKLMRIINTKEDIRQALISKGYDVPTSIPFKEYAKMILDLPCKVDSFPDIEGIVADIQLPVLLMSRWLPIPYGLIRRKWTRFTVEKLLLEENVRGWRICSGF